MLERELYLATDEVVEYDAKVPYEVTGQMRNRLNKTAMHKTSFVEEYCNQWRLPQFLIYGLENLNFYDHMT